MSYSHKIGEIIGGSQREENYDKLYTRAKEMGVPEKRYLVVSRYTTLRDCPGIPVSV